VTDYQPAHHQNTQYKQQEHEDNLLQ